MHSIESRWDIEPKHLLFAGCRCALSLEILQSVAVKGLTSSSPLPIPVSICMMILVEKKFTNRCAKSVYHSGEHVVTYTKTLCLFHCTKSINFITVGTKTLHFMSFLLHQEYLPHWGPKPYTKTLCLFYAPRAFITLGTKTLH